MAGKCKKVLVIDDDEDDRMTAKDALAEARVSNNIRFGGAPSGRSRRLPLRTRPPADYDALPSAGAGGLQVAGLKTGKSSVFSFTISISGDNGQGGGS